MGLGNTIRTKHLFFSVFLLAIAALSWPPNPALCQPPTSARLEPPSAKSDKSGEFRPVTGSQNERVPGGLMLVTAYGAVWLLLFAYIVGIGRANAKMAHDLDQVEQKLRKIQSRDDREVDKNLNTPALNKEIC